MLGALATRDWRPMHHDKDFAQQRNGVRDIFLNTPNQAAWFERYLTDWTGPHGRLGRMRFRMKDSVFPGDRMQFRARVEKVAQDDDGLRLGRRGRDALGRRAHLHRVRGAHRAPGRRRPQPLEARGRPLAAVSRPRAPSRRTR